MIPRAGRFQSLTPKHSQSRTPSRNRYSEAGKESKQNYGSSRIKQKYTTYNKNIKDMETIDIGIQLPQLEPVHKIKQVTRP